MSFLSITVGSECGGIDAEPIILPDRLRRPLNSHVRTVRTLAAYLLAPAVMPIAALLYWAFLAEPPCPDCSTPVWVQALPMLFFTYPATLVIAVPTLRLLPSPLRGPLSGPPVAGAVLALLVFLLFVVGMHGGPSRLAVSAAGVAFLGAISAAAFVVLLGSERTSAYGTLQLSVRGYLPFFTLFVAVEGGAFFGQFSCGGYAIVRDLFGLFFLVVSLSSSLFGQGFLTSVPRRTGFFFGAQLLFVVVQAMSSPFYPAPPHSLAEYFRLFVLGLTNGPC